MSKVFFGGSRSVSRLNTLVRERIDNIMSQGFEVVIGDANGADKALQEYLADRKYDNVIVFCSGDVCRNNIGNWKTVFVATSRTKVDFEYYARKDARMAGEADYGFFLWNGKSRGTLNSIQMLLKNGRPVLVYLSPEKRFVVVKEERDLGNALGKLDSGGSLRHELRSQRIATPVAQKSLFG